ncbi:lasso peptide biosynthesis B2 protein [Burkholderia perseverans]|uniref:lasso peptide biosynthesis B2 protein n=1 Tax=Burkholderia perseverans TaxID=2615214 RepID=UPI001FEFC282|nr:lasso peptide biosynthesis B2 protein [Burkholderia perseverans]
MPFKFNDNIQHILLHDSLIIFDEKNDTFLVLPEDTTREVLSSFEDMKDRAGIVEHLVQESILISADTRQYISTISMSGYGIGDYRWDRREHLITAVRFRYVVEALAVAISLKLRLASLGLPRILAQMRTSKKRTPPRRDDLIYPQQLAYSLTRASHFLPFRFECLEFSCALFKILIRKGYHPTFHIGVQNYNFLSHAWIDINGVVIGDRADMFQRISPIVSI